MKKIKGIIFDLDGVIVFTDHYHYLAWKQLADTIGVYFDQTINNRLRGVSRMASLEIILENYQGKPFSVEEKIAIAEAKNNLYRELLKQMSPIDVTDEVRTTLQTLKKRNYKLAIGSSSKNAPFILKQVNLEEFFDVKSDGNNIAHSKPNPEVFLKAAEYLSLKPEECAVVEDAHAGIEAAKKANMFALAIGDASNCEAADYKLKTFSDLLNIFKGQ